MTDKISCPTLHVVLIKAIRALCEVTIKFDHTLEITGSLHVRSDGDKVLTCLLNEDCIKSTTSHLNDVALKLNLVNAALALNNISIVQNTINKANEVAVNQLPLIASSRNLGSFSTDVTPPRSIMPVVIESNACASANVFSFGGGHISAALSDNNNNLKNSKNSKAANSRCRKKVETVARTLASIKTGTHSIADRSIDFNQMDAPVKLPDIQTLAHRLPSYEAATGEVEGPSGFQGVKAKVQSPSSGSVLVAPIKNSPESIKKETMEEGMDIKPHLQKGQARVKKFQCMFCGIFLSTKCYLKNHVNAMHTRLHVYKCDLCEHSFYSAGAMRIHKLRNHWHDSKKHRCSECNESFLLPIELRKHIQKRHHHLQTTPTTTTNVTSNAFSVKHQQAVANAFGISSCTGKRGAVNLSVSSSADLKMPESLDRMKVEPGDFSQSSSAKKHSSSSSSSHAFSIHNGVVSESM